MFFFVLFPYGLTIFVTALPVEFQSKLQNQTVQSLGASVQVTCQLTRPANQCTVAWFKAKTRDQLTAADGKYDFSNQDNGNAALTINNFEIADAGKYTIVVNGAVESSAQIRVEGDFRNLLHEAFY